MSSSSSSSKKALKLFSQWKSLSLKSADEIASKAISIAERNKFAPVAICVMDAVGHPIVTKVMDGCPPMAYSKISKAKANTCVSMKMSSRAYGEKYLQKTVGPDVFGRVLSQIAAVDGEAVAFPGGVLIRDKITEEILGSVGISGAAGAEDEYCALRAIQTSQVASEVVTEPAEHDCATVIIDDDE
jgi:uncharacterized protein GlcG (DUF336 family)